MSALHKSLLSDVDNEGATHVRHHTLDGSQGLKVDGGLVMDRQNSENKSSSIEVISDRFPASLKRPEMDHLDLQYTRPKKKQHHKLDEIQQEIFHLNELAISPSKSNKGTDNLTTQQNLTELEDVKLEILGSTATQPGAMKWIKLIGVDKENSKLILDSEAVAHLTQIDRILIPLSSNVIPPDYVEGLSQRRHKQSGISMRQPTHPKDSSSPVLVLDISFEDTYTEAASKNMWKLVSMLVNTFWFWIPKNENTDQYHRVLANFTDTLKEMDNLFQKLSQPSPERCVHLIYHQCNTEEPQQTGLNKQNTLVDHLLRSIPSYQVHSLDLEQTIDWNQDRMDPWTIEPFYEKQMELLEISKPISMFGAFLNGQRFVQLLEICVDEINSGTTNMVQRFTSTVKNDIDLLIAKLATQYLAQLKDNTQDLMPVHENILEREHQSIQENTIKILAREALLTDTYFEKVMKDLKTKIEESYQQILEQNRHLSGEKCQLLVEDCFRDVFTKLNARIYGVDSTEYQADLEQAIAKYKNTPGKGPQADDVLVGFMKKLGKRRKQTPTTNHGEDIINDILNHGDLDSWMSQTSDVPDQRKRIADSSDREVSRESQRTSNLGEKSAQVHEIVFGLEQQVTELQTEVDVLRVRLSKKETELIANPIEKESAAVGTNTEKLSLSPLTSLSPQDSQWIHVEKQQGRDKQGDAACVCKEITEREVRLQHKNNKLKEQIKELAEANSAWEKHCAGQQNELTNQITGLMQELDESKKQIRRLERDAEMEEERRTAIETEAQKKISDAEEQKTKAIGFASAQAEKVDELKRNLRKEKQHTQELDMRVRELQAQVAALSVANRDMGQRENESPQASVTAPLQMLHLSTDNRPPPTATPQRSMDGYDGHPSYQSSRWESIPPSLLVEPPVAENNPCCRRLQKRLSQLDTEIKVMRQQVTIYKDDFKKERRDRENAHSEIASLQSSCVQLEEDNKLLQERGAKKSREVEALRGAREHDQMKIQQRQEQIERLEHSRRSDARKIADLQAQVQRLKRQPAQLPIQPPPPYDAVPRNNPPATNTELYWGNDGFMPREWRNQLQRNYVYFVNYLKPYDVVNQLYARDLLDFGTKLRLDAMAIDSDKTSYLFQNVVTRFTRQELMTFKQVLIDTNQVDLAQKLPSENYSGPAWHCSQCTYKNQPTRDRCEMCQNRAPGLEPLAGVRPVEQCDGEVQWVQPASLGTDAPTDAPINTAMEEFGSSSLSERCETVANTINNRLKKN